MWMIIWIIKNTLDWSNTRDEKGYYKKLHSESIFKKKIHSAVEDKK